MFYDNYYDILFSIFMLIGIVCVTYRKYLIIDLYNFMQMIDNKLSLVTIRDINPSCSNKLDQIIDKLNKLNIKYNLSIVPNFNKKHNLKDNTDFCNKILTLLDQRLENIEITLHGLHHEIDRKIVRF